MGYVFSIGEATVEWNRDSCRIWPEEIFLDAAPAFGDHSDYRNTRAPSYCTWADFVKDMNVQELMNGSDNFEGLLVSHPGTAPIVPEHVEFLEKAIAHYKKQHPGHIAKYWQLKPGIEEERFNPLEDYDQNPLYDGNLCRAEWLLWWLRWAVKNCEKPVFANI